MTKLNLPFSVDLPRHAGARPRIHPADCAAYSLAGQVPKVVFSPRTADETAKVIDAMRREGASISIRGSGSKQWRPPAARALDAVVDMTRCAGILDYTPADLTVSVAAGTPFAELQTALRAQGQFFPSDPPFSATATLGGVFSSRSNGALRQRYGALRDNVLGMRVCLSDGSVAFTGAKVVKSVAGYDVAKVFVGAWGSLGAIAEVNLKVAPLPAHERALIAYFPSVEAGCDAALRIALSPLYPLATVLLHRRALRHVRAIATEGPDWTLIVRCGGNHAAVVRQLDGARIACTDCGASGTHGLEGDRIPHAWSDICELAGGSSYPAHEFVALKIAALPTQSAACAQEVALACPEAELTLHPALGIVYAGLPASGTAAILHSLDVLSQKCAASAWQIEYVSAPPRLGLSQPFPPLAPLGLMRRIKAELDPSGTFDPGRLLAGI